MINDTEAAAIILSTISMSHAGRENSKVQSIFC
jgi:hypothetical protein